jgi:hypothetical protein
VTRVQFRLPDGARVVRRFRVDETVAALFRHVSWRLKVRHSLAGASSGGVVVGGFDLTIPQGRGTLSSCANDTLADAGVTNATVMVTLTVV